MLRRSMATLSVAASSSRLRAIIEAQRRGRSLGCPRSSRVFAGRRRDAAASPIDRCACGAGIMLKGSTIVASNARWSSGSSTHRRATSLKAALRARAARQTAYLRTRCHHRPRCSGASRAVRRRAGPQDGTARERRFRRAQTHRCGAGRGRVAVCVRSCARGAAFRRVRPFKSLLCLTPYLLRGARVREDSRECLRRNRCSVATAGVVGAGTMGSGIAIAFAQAGIPVIVVDKK